MLTAILNELINLYHSLDKFSTRQSDYVFLIFTRKKGFDISCTLSPKETICKKYQSVLSGRHKKNISNCHLLKLSLCMLSVKSQHLLIYCIKFVEDLTVCNLHDNYVNSTHYYHEQEFDSCRQLQEDRDT